MFLAESGDGSLTTTDGIIGDIGIVDRVVVPLEPLQELQVVLELGLDQLLHVDSLLEVHSVESQLQFLSIRSSHENDNIIHNHTQTRDTERRLFVSLFFLFCFLFFLFFTL